MADEEIQGVTPAQAGEQAESAPASGPESTPPEVDGDTGDNSTAPPAQVEDHEEPKPPKGVQKRIDELVRQREEERRRADRLEAMLAQTLPKQQEQTQTQAQQEPAFNKPRPELKDFGFDESKHAEAVADWAMERAESRLSAKQQQATQQTQQEQFRQAVSNAKAKTMEDGAAKYPDFVGVVESLPANVLTEDMAFLIINTDSPEDVAYHLGKNPQEAARISQLPPVGKAIEIGRIHERIKAAKPPAKTPSNAPPPPTPLKPTGTASNDYAELAKNDMDAYYRKRTEELKKAGRF